MTTNNGINNTLDGATATSLTFSPTTSGIVGTTTNNNASAGIVGEFVTSNVPSGSPISLTNNTAANVTSISLTAGDWDVFGNVAFLFGPTSAVTNTICWTSTTSATNKDISNESYYSDIQTGSNANIGLPTPYLRVNVSTTTTVYLSAFVNFTGVGATALASGTIFARRVR